MRIRIRQNHADPTPLLAIPSELLVLGVLADHVDGVEDDDGEDLVQWVHEPTLQQ